MFSKESNHSSTSNGCPGENGSLQKTQTISNSFSISVLVDSNNGHVETSSDSNERSSEDETPDPSWFKAATILLSLKSSAEARLKGARNGMGCSNPTWPPYSPPRDETNNHVTNGVSANQSNGYHHYDNDYTCEEEDNKDVTGKVTNLENGDTSAEEQQDSFEDDDDEMDKDLSTTCSLCHKVYSRPSTLKAHLRIHTGEKPFQCSICNKSFSQDANLKAHLRVHSKEKPFKCQICQRRFAQSSSVTTHMRIHSGERPYKCKVCSRGFADSSTLTKHLRIHTGEKPYQCKICDMRFSQSGNLSRHMRVHRRKK